MNIYLFFLQNSFNSFEGIVLINEKFINSKYCEKRLWSTFGEILKLYNVISPDKLDSQLLRFLLMIGIKHQIIRTKGASFEIDYDSVLGRECLPQFIASKPEFEQISQFVLKDGVVSQKQIKNTYDQLVEFIDQGFITVQGQYEQVQEDKVEVQNGESKKQKKNKKLEQKKEQIEEKQKMFQPDSYLQLNYKGVLQYLKQEAIVQFVKKQHDEGVSQIIKQFFVVSKDSDTIIPISKLLSGQSQSQITNALALFNISSVDGNQVQVPVNDLKKLKQYVRQKLLYQWTVDKWGQRAARVLQVLRREKRLDEKNICDIAFMDLLEVRDIIIQLMKDQAIDTESIKIEQKITQFFIYDYKKLKRQFQDQFYQSLVNAQIRKQELYQWLLIQYHLL
ncbi:hypothetical protein pb186bvf_002055 [Paramecium bursaria]